MSENKHTPGSMTPTPAINTVGGERLAEMLVEVETEIENALADAVSDQNPQLAVNPVAEFSMTELRSILTELIARRAADGAGVRVKGLEWTGSDPDYSTAQSILGRYEVINTFQDRGFMAQFAGSKSASYFPSLDEAKAAAEDDHRTRILSSIEPSKAEAGEVVGDWVLVPREPTTAMMDAGLDVQRGANANQRRAIWGAMLAAAPTSPQGNEPEVTEGVRPYPELLTEDERKAILADAERLWSDLQRNDLGGYSDGNRPFYILHAFKLAIEKYGRRDVGLNWSKNDLEAALSGKER